MAPLRVRFLISFHGKKEGKKKKKKKKNSDSKGAAGKKKKKKNSKKKKKKKSAMGPEEGSAGANILDGGLVRIETEPSNMISSRIEQPDLCSDHPSYFNPSCSTSRLFSFVMNNCQLFREPHIQDIDMLLILYALYTLDLDRIVHISREPHTMLALLKQVPGHRHVREHAQSCFFCT